MCIFNRTKKLKHPLPLQLFILFVVVVVLLIPKSAEAFLLKEAANLIATAISLFFGLILNIEGWIINWLLDPKIWDEVFVKNPTIIAAWRIMRDFVNLGFVLALVVIAIGFILRLQTYGSQRTLIRLIIAALLVNFSLMIAGIFIDISTMLSRFFLDGFKLSNIWASLLSATGAYEFWAPSEKVPFWSKVVSFIIRTVNPLEDIKQAAGVLAKTFLTSIFAIMMIAALGALIVMLLIRIAWLWMLLILSPIAWLMWIFPQFEHNWRRWWNDFLRWTFFAPIVLFFLAIALAIVSNPVTKNALNSAEKIAADVFSNVLAANNETPNSLIARFTLSLSLIVFGMIIANQLSISFAEQGVQWVRTIAKQPAAAAWRAGVREIKERFATSRLGRALEERSARSRVPGLGRVSDQIRMTRADVEAEAKKLAERYAILSSSQIREDLTDRSKRALMSRAEFLARALVLNERGEKLPDEIADTILRIAHNINPRFAEQFLVVNPKLVQIYEAQIARRPEAQQRTIADYAARMTAEQAVSFNRRILEELSASERALFASGIQQSILAHMLEKNYESGEMLLNILRNTAELRNQLRSAGRSEQEIRQTITRIERMLKSPQLAYWTGIREQPAKPPQPPQPTASPEETVRQAEEYLRQTGQYPFAT